MGAEGDESKDTRQRLLESAVDVFAEQGFHQATVHEICKGAGANIAAVNYYFGSKENLYAEAWQKAVRDSLAAHPPDGGVPPDAAAEQRLRGRIAGLVGRGFDQDSKEPFFMHHELAQPTGLLERLVRETMRPMREQTESVIRELLGPGVPEREVGYCAMSVHSQCFEVIHRRAHHRRHHPDKDEPHMLVIDDVDAYVEHVVTFSLGGIRAVRERSGSGAGKPGRGRG